MAESSENKSFLGKVLLAFGIGTEEKQPPLPESILNNLPTQTQTPENVEVEVLPPPDNSEAAKISASLTAREDRAATIGMGVGNQGGAVGTGDYKGSASGPTPPPTIKTVPPSVGG